MQWTKVNNEDYTNLTEMYNQAISQLRFYLGHVTKYVGGIMETPKMVEEQGSVYEYVSAAKQKEAVDFLNKQIFITPTWLINQEIFGRTGLNGLTVIGGLQDNVLAGLFSPRVFTNLLNGEAANGNSAYQLNELLTDVKKGVWSELPAHKPIDIYRRNLQKSYVASLTSFIGTGSQPVTIGGVTVSVTTGSDKSDIRSVVSAHLASLRAEINAAAASSTDAMTKYHLQDVSKRIDNALNPK
jgi:hypothetical protein